MSHENHLRKNKSKEKILKQDIINNELKNFSKNFKLEIFPKILSLNFPKNFKLHNKRMNRNDANDAKRSESLEMINNELRIFSGKPPYNKRMNQVNQNNQNNPNDVTRPELLELCKKRGFKNYRNLKKCELAKLLEIELPKKSARKEEIKCRKSRCVEILNFDGTTTAYPSMSKAAKYLGVYPMQIYVLIARGNARFLDMG